MQTGPIINSKKYAITFFSILQYPNASNTVVQCSVDMPHVLQMCSRQWVLDL